MKAELSVHHVGRGEPLILLHGWGMSACVFDPFRDLLAVRREVITVDLPGYGLSPWHSGLSFEDQVALILEQVPAGTLLGWSMGGLFATEMVRQAPDRFDRLILMCSTPCFVRRDDWKCAVDAAVFDAFAQSLKGGWASTMKHFLSLQMLGDANARQLIRALMIQLKLAGEPSVPALIFGLDLLKTLDTRPVLSEISLPIDMIFSERDELVPMSITKEISKINPNIRIESIMDAAHVPFLSHAAQIVSII